MQLQKAISDLFKNNKYGSLVPVPAVRPGALCADRAQATGRVGTGNDREPTAPTPRTTGVSASRRWERARAPAGGLAGAHLPGRLPPWAPHGAGSSSASGVCLPSIPAQASGRRCSGGDAGPRPGEAAWGPRAAADPPNLSLHLRCFLFRRQEAKRGCLNDRQEIKIGRGASDLQEKELKVPAWTPPPARAPREPHPPSARPAARLPRASAMTLRAPESSSPGRHPSAPLTGGQVTGVYLIGTIRHSTNTNKSSLCFLVVI